MYGCPEVAKGGGNVVSSCGGLSVLHPPVRGCCRPDLPAHYRCFFAVVVRRNGSENPRQGAQSRRSKGLQGFRRLSFFLAIFGDSAELMASVFAVKTPQARWGGTYRGEGVFCGAGLCPVSGGNCWSYFLFKKQPKSAFYTTCSVLVRVSLLPDTTTPDGGRAVMSGSAMSQTSALMISR